MSHSLGVRGKHGRLKVGYRVAASLGAFELLPGEWRVSASVESTDAFWLSQGAARTLELEVGRQRWIWRDVSLAVADGTVTGTVVGRPERR
jgi:hypothetical protein